jgi:hypothetical protein
MSAPETILRRWSRRKLEAFKGAGSAFAERDDAAKGRAGTEAVSATRSDGDARAHEAVDPPSLPQIESITASTDIRAFLQSGVPLELTRGALRRAWTTDPAICDFIGIAENQWDFNDPTAIPGFGPLRSTEVANLARQLLADADGTIDHMAQACSPVVPQEDAPDRVAPDALVGPTGEGHAKR